MFSGYNPLYFKLFIWTLSAVICGIAGALYVPQVGIINPSEMSPANSIEIAIWAAVGGRGTLIGPDHRRGRRQRRARAGSRRRCPSTGCSFSACCSSWSRCSCRAASSGLCDGGDELQARGHADERRGVHSVDSGSAGLAQAGMRIAGDGVDITPRRRSSISIGITVSFDGFKALNDLTLTIDAGELRCVIGPNGAGKTTMMDVITGKTRPDAGTAFFGQTIDLTRLVRSRDRRTPASAASSRSRRCSSEHTVFENLELAMKADKRVWPTLSARLDSHRRSTGSPRCSTRSSSRAEAERLAGLAVARPEAVARDRHAADAGAAAAAARRAGRGHDRRRDDAQRRALPLARRAAHAGRRRARHGLRRAHRATA